MKNQITPVSQDLCQAINKLTELLKQEFKTDYSFRIFGHGHMIAASNVRDGVVNPVCKPYTQEDRILRNFNAPLSPASYYYPPDSPGG